MLPYATNELKSVVEFSLKCPREPLNQQQWHSHSHIVNAVPKRRATDRYIDSAVS